MKTKLTVFLLTFIMVVCGMQSARAQWTQTSLDSRIGVHAFAAIGTNLFAATDHGVFLSPDDGTSWAPAAAGITNTMVLCLAAHGQNLFAGTNTSGVFLSTDNGTSWVAANNGLKSGSDEDGFVVSALAVNGNNIFAAVYNSGVFLSTNDGADWTKTTSYNGTDWIRAFAVSGANLFAGTNGNSVILSTDNGESWKQASAGLTNTNGSLTAASFAVSGSLLYAATTGGVFSTADDGANWLPANYGMEKAYVKALALSGKNLFAGLGPTNNKFGVFLSQDDGANWIAFNSGLPNQTFIASLVVNGNYLFAGNSGVWRRSLTELTGVEDNRNDNPSGMALEPNYPNPVKGDQRASIGFTLPKAGYASIKLYDMIGRFLAAVYEGNATAGSQRVWFDAAALRPGVYTYVLRSGNITLSKRAIVAK